jgi:hypothetical protein
MSDKLFIQDGEKKREFTDAEYAQYELDKIEFANSAVQTQSKVEAKAALLEKLGITTDEAQLLLS